jgi:hypothetical protein
MENGSFKDIVHAEVAQLVERNLAKVEVAGSSLVFRSKRFRPGKPRSDIKSTGQRPVFF